MLMTQRRGPDGPPVRTSSRVRPALLGWVLIAGALTSASAEDLSSPAGLWQPLDSRTGQPLGLIRIYSQGDAWFGRIEPSPGDDPTERCTRCTDERRNQPLGGLVLMRNLRLRNGEYTGGDILDPDTGRIYGCRFRLIEGGRKLVMHGFLGLSLLGRDQVWRRAAGR